MAKKKQKPASEEAIQALRDKAFGVDSVNSEAGDEIQTLKKAVQSQKARIQELTAEVDKLKAELAEKV